MTKSRFAYSAISALLCCSLLVGNSAVWGANFALLIAIADYPSFGVRDDDDLPGTKDDLRSFRELARKMGVPDKNITTLADRQASQENIIGALASLTQRVTERDNVIVTYSGHGAQLHNPESQKPGHCAEGIVIVGEGGAVFLPDQLLRKHFDMLSEKAGKVIVFFDSCFSGGALKTRGMDNGSDLAKLRPKAFRGEAVGGVKSECGNAVNARGIARGLTDGKRNMVFFAAAAHNEVAMDAGESMGGLGTMSWMKCLNDSATDRDRSGAISGEELQACAQQKVREISISHFQRRDAMQHPKLEGAGSVTLTFSEQSMTNSSENSVTTSTGSAIAALNDIHNGRNLKWDVGFKSSKSVYRIRQDQVDLTLSSARKGYLYLLMVGTGADAQGVVLIFPNELDRDNLIEAGKPLMLPRQGKWRLTPGGPVGTDHLLAVVSETPVDFSKAGMSRASIFQLSGASQGALGSFQHSITRSLLVEVAEDSGSNYGATLLRIQEKD